MLLYNMKRTPISPQFMYTKETYYNMTKYTLKTLIAFLILCQVAAYGDDASTNVSSSGSAPTDVEAKQILEKATAQEAQFSTYFCESEQERTDGINKIHPAKTKLSIFKKRNADGQIFQRIETEVTIQKPPISIKSLEIVNSDGSWRVNDKVAILEAYKAKESDDIFSAAANAGLTGPLSNDNPPTYDKTEKQVDGKACYAIREHFSDKAISQWKEMIKKTTGNDPQDNYTPVFREYIIGKEDSIIYGVAMYSVTGDAMTKQTWSTVKFNPPLDEEMFRIPNKLRKLTANSAQEERDLLKQSK